MKIEKSAHRWLRFLGIILVLVFWPAKPGTLAAQAEDPQGAAGRVAVLLILDNSGSMNTSDPNGLRFTAARLFLALLDESDLAGVLIFSTESRVLTNGLEAVSNLRGGATLAAGLKLGPAEGWTDVQNAFARGRDLLAEKDLSGYRTVIVFLTDGKPETQTSGPDYDEETLELIRSINVPVLSIALTPAAQTPFLSRVAAETGGAVQPAKAAADLLDAYLQIFTQVKDRTVLEGGQTDLSGRAAVEIDPGLAPFVEEAKFIVSTPFQAAVILTSPDGKAVHAEMPGVQFDSSEDPNFKVVTVKGPAGGRWEFSLKRQGTGLAQPDAQPEVRAILRSRLRLLAVPTAPVQEADQPLLIGAYLVEEQRDGRMVKVIGHSRFTALITRPDGRQERLDRFYDDGTHGDPRAGDGEYFHLYTNAGLPGNYEISLQGWKGQVALQETILIEAVEFPRIVVDSPREERHPVRGLPIPLQVHLEGGNPSRLDQGEIIVRIAAPSGVVFEHTLRREAGSYVGEFLPEENGIYTVRFEPLRAAYTGVPYTHTASVRFDVLIIPSMSIMNEAIDLGQLEAVALEDGVVITLTVKSTSRGMEWLNIDLDGLPQFSLLPEGPYPVFPGRTNEISLVVKSQERVSPGEYAGSLLFTAREGLDLPMNHLPLKIKVAQPFWVHLQRPLFLTGGALLALLSTAILTARRIKNRQHNPQLTGTLRLWMENRPASVREIDLTALKRQEAAIGRGEECDICLPDSSIGLRHAILRAEKLSGQVQACLEPLEEVKIGYRVLHQAAALKHGEKFIIGRWVLQFLSDEGHE